MVLEGPFNRGEKQYRLRSPAHCLHTRSDEIIISLQRVDVIRGVDFRDEYNLCDHLANKW